jgi:flavin reductase (DIM6/NTAB) family NADH-FMN oxidoreductase RutF
MKISLISPSAMLQFIIDEMEQYNTELSNDFAFSFFKWELLEPNLLSVTIKKKTYQLSFIEKGSAYTISIYKEEIAAIEDVESVILFLLL